jgi:hypothetical protein
MRSPLVWLAGLYLIAAIAPARAADFQISYTAWGA